MSKPVTKSTYLNFTDDMEEFELSMLIADLDLGFLVGEEERAQARKILDEDPRTERIRAKVQKRLHEMEIKMQDPVYRKKIEDLAEKIIQENPK